MFIINIIWEKIPTLFLQTPGAPTLAHLVPSAPTFEDVFDSSQHISGRRRSSLKEKTAENRVKAQYKYILDLMQPGTDSPEVSSEYGWPTDWKTSSSNNMRLLPPLLWLCKTKCFNKEFNLERAIIKWSNCLPVKRSTTLCYRPGYMQWMQNGNCNFQACSWYPQDALVVHVCVKFWDIALKINFYHCFQWKVRQTFSICTALN